MKKFFFSCVSLLLGLSAYAGSEFHAPAQLYPRAPFEYVNLSNALTNEVTKDGAAKYGINDQHSWIVYNYSGSILDNGKCEVSRGGIYVSKNPVTMADEFVYMVDDAQKWLGSPKTEVGWTKNEDGTFNLLPKTIAINIKDASRIDLLLTGGGSNTNLADVIVKDMATGEIVQSLKTDTLAGKSSKANAANTKSQYLTITGLDLAKSYQIIVAPAASATQVEALVEDEFGDKVKTWVPYTATENFLADVPSQSISNVKGPSVYLAAMRIFGDGTMGGMMTPAPNAGTTHVPGDKYPRTSYEYINLSNTLCNDAIITSFDAEGVASTAKKYAIKGNYPWIYYNYTGSVLDNGQMEVGRGGVYVSKNPITGADEFVYMVDDAQLWLGSPKCEVGYTRETIGDKQIWKLCPKTITFNVEKTQKVSLLLTGGGSNTNIADVIVKDMATGEIVQSIKSETLVGKSNKANAANTNSQYLTISDLDLAKKYMITVAPAASATQVEALVEDEFGDQTKTWIPYTTTENFLADVPGLEISNIKSPAVYVCAIQLTGEDDSIESANMKDVVAKAKAAGKSEITLVAGVDYDLDSAVDADAITINGNGSKIVATENGQFVAKASIALDGVNLDASASTVAPIRLANKDELTAADTTALASWKVVEDSPAVLYTQAEADAYNDANALVEGDEGFVKAGDVKVAATTKNEFKYEGANQKVFESQLISITNSEITTVNSAISGGDAPWALRNLTIDNSVIKFTDGSKIDKKENISFYGGASSIQSINLTNSTFVCTVESNSAYFLRYSNASNSQPQKVWGTTGTASWTMTANTFVNIASNGQFANNYSNKNNVTLDFKKNVFANTRYLQKIGSSCVRNFTAADNVICGGTNSVDGTDASTWATLDEELGVTAENFTPDVYYSLAAVKGYGDPRHLKAHVDLVPAGSYFATATITPADGVTVPASLQKYVAEGYETKFTVDAEGNITAGEGLLAGAKIAINKIGYTADTQFTIEGQTVSLGAEAGSLKLSQVENGVQVADFDIYKAGIKVGTVTNFVITTVSTGIKNVESAAAVKSVNAKFIENGRVVIVKNGAKFNVAGQVIK